MHMIDIALIVIYFAVVLGIGLKVAGKTESDEDLFLAGRSLKWHSIGFSLFASNISSTTLIGLCGAAYVWGIAVSNYEWMAALILAFFVVFMVPFYINSKISTIPEFLERRFDHRSRRYFSALTILANIVVDTAGGLYAGAIVIQMFFPSVNILVSCIGLALVAGLYTAAGGLAAVVYTDVIQAIILLIGSCILTVIAFGELDYSRARIVAEVPPESLSLMLPANDPNLPWVGTLIGVPVLGFYFWCTNQFIVQRVLGAKSVNHARWGSLFGGLLKLPVLFIMVFPGIMARILYPDLPEPDVVFPTMVVDLLPMGIMGLVMAGLIAAIMSSVDSTLNSASALVSLDFIKPMRPDLTPQQMGRIGRITILVFMVIAAAFAPVIGGFEGLFNYLQSALSYLVPPVAALFLVGLFWKRANAPGAFFTLLGGHAISAVLFGLQVSGIYEMHFTIVAGVLFAVSCVLLVVISLMTAPPTAEQISELTWDPERAKIGVDPAPWWADYRLLSGALLALTAVLVITFW